MSEDKVFGEYDFTNDWELFTKLDSIVLELKRRNSTLEGEYQALKQRHYSVCDKIFPYLPGDGAVEDDEVDFDRMSERGLEFANRSPWFKAKYGVTPFDSKSINTTKYRFLTPKELKKAGYTYRVHHHRIPTGSNDYMKEVDVYYTKGGVEFQLNASSVCKLLEKFEKSDLSNLNEFFTLENIEAGLGLFKAKEIKDQEQINTLNEALDDALKSNTFNKETPDLTATQSLLINLDKKLEDIQHIVNINKKPHSSFLDLAPCGLNFNHKDMPSVKTTVLIEKDENDKKFVSGQAQTFLFKFQIRFDHMLLDNTIYETTLKQEQSKAEDILNKLNQDGLLLGFVGEPMYLFNSLLGGFVYNFSIVTYPFMKTNRIRSTEQNMCSIPDYAKPYWVNEMGASEIFKDA